MSKSDFHEIDRPIAFDVPDEDLERAGGACEENIPTLVGTYCFTCPSDQEIAN